MAPRIPLSQRTREKLTAVIEGRLSTSSTKDELSRTAATWRQTRASSPLLRGLTKRAAVTS